MFSKACEYSIKAVIHISHQSQSDTRATIKNIAAAIDSPIAFTGKIMQQLSKNGIVQSTKGPSGGFWISEKDRKKINLRRIVEVIDGNQIFVKCCLGLPQCNDKMPCPLHSQYAQIRELLNKMLTDTSLEELAKKLDVFATLK